MPTAREATEEETIDPSVVGATAATDAINADDAPLDLAPPEAADQEVIDALGHHPHPPIDVEPAPVHEHHQIEIHHDHHGHGIHVENTEYPPPMPMGEEDHGQHHHQPVDVDDAVHTTGTVEDPLAAHIDHHGVELAGTEVPGHDPEQAALDAGEEAAAAAMEAAAAAEAAEAAIGNVLDDVGVDVHTAAAAAAAAGAAAIDHSLEQHAHEAAAAAMDPSVGTHEDDEVALAAAAAAAAVQAADGMAVVVDQALLATAAAAAASQVAEVLAEQQQQQNGGGYHHGMHHSHDPYHDLSPSKLGEHHLHDHGDLLLARREKDRKRYSAMTPEARAAYNAHRRELYHKQGENARKRRRERERDRYHSLEGDAKKTRNERRAKLERDRYNRLSKDELAGRNSKRRDRAKVRKVPAKNINASTVAVAAMPHLGMAAPMPMHTEEMGVLTHQEVYDASTIPPPHAQQQEMMIKNEIVMHHGEEVEVPNLPDNVMPEVYAETGDSVMDAPLPEATVDVSDSHHMADASALAAEVAEQVIAGSHLDGALEAAAAVSAQSGMEEEGPTVQI